MVNRNDVKKKIESIKKWELELKKSFENGDISEDVYMFGVSNCETNLKSLNDFLTDRDPKMISALEACSVQKNCSECFERYRGFKDNKNLIPCEQIKLKYGGDVWRYNRLKIIF